MAWRRHRSGLLVPQAEAGWLPTDLSNLEGWYRADTLTKDGSNLVSSWTDQSGNTRHVTEGSNKPLWVDAQFNGQPVVRFDGSNDHLDITGLSLSAPIHLFMVVKQISWTVNDPIFAFSDTTYLRSHAVSPDVKQSESFTSLNPVSMTVGTAFLLSSFWNGAASYQALNNGSISGPNSTGSNSFDAFAFASRPTDGNFANCDIAEVIVTSSEVTGADLTALQTYINARYALW